MASHLAVFSDSLVSSPFHSFFAFDLCICLRLLPSPCFEPSDRKQQQQQSADSCSSTEL